MPTDEQHHVALPKLIGAPAYARPPRIYAAAERPPDTDDLPLEALQTDEERALAASLRGRPYTAAHAPPEPIPGPSDGLRPRPFSLRALGRLLGGDRG